MAVHWWRSDPEGSREPIPVDADGPAPEAYRTLARVSPGVVVHLDASFVVVAVGDEISAVTGFDPDDVLGRHVSSLLAAGEFERIEGELRELLARDRTTRETTDLLVRHADGSTVPCELAIGTQRVDDEFVGAIGVLRELDGGGEGERPRAVRDDAPDGARDDGAGGGPTDRGRGGEDDAAWEARKYRRIFEEARDAVLVADDEGSYVDANPAASDLLGLPREQLLGRSIAEFAPAGYDFEDVWSEFLEDGTLEETFPLVRPDGEERLVEFAAVADVLPDRHLSILRDVTERSRRERELERQRERLTVLNHLNAVVRTINDAIVKGSTREEIEREACSALADSPSYEFAFVAEVDALTGDVLDRVEAGVSGYVDSIPLSTDPDDPAGRGPVGRAIRTQEIQFSSDVLADPDFEPWRDDARERGYRAAAAIPITYDGTLYGVLGVTTARRGAFADEEREVVGQLGEQLGHAIAALERKLALMHDELVELEFVVPDVFDLLEVPERTDDRIAFEGSVPVGDDEFLSYGTTTPEALPALRELAERGPYYESVTVLDEGPSDVRFEVHMSGPSLYALAASLGGYVDEAVIVGGDFVLTIHLPQGGEVRQVIEAVREAYPNARNVARRQVERDRLTPREMQHALVEELTPRQRTVLELAYFAGYFDWPRECSGEELADRLGVSPATFHQHLRAAEEKLFAALLE